MAWLKAGRGSVANAPWDTIIVGRMTQLGVIDAMLQSGVVGYYQTSFPFLLPFGGET